MADNVNCMQSISWIYQVIYMAMQFKNAKIFALDTWHRKCSVFICILFWWDCSAISTDNSGHRWVSTFKWKYFLTERRLSETIVSVRALIGNYILAENEHLFWSTTKARWCENLVWYGMRRATLTWNIRTLGLIKCISNNVSISHDKHKRAGEK